MNWSVALMDRVKYSLFGNDSWSEDVCYPQQPIGMLGTCITDRHTDASSTNNEFYLEHMCHACTHSIQALCLVISLVCRYSSEVMGWTGSVPAKMRIDDSGGLLFLVQCYVFSLWNLQWCDVNCVLFDQFHTAKGWHSNVSCTLIFILG